MKLLFKHKKAFLKYLLTLIAGIIVASLFWSLQLKDSRSLLDYRVFEINNLNDQIQSLRTDYRVVTRSKPQKSIPFTHKKALNSNNDYSIRCLDEKSRGEDPFFEKIKQTLNQDEEVGAFCYNTEIKKAVLLTNKQNQEAPPNSKEYIVSFKIYDTENGSKEYQRGNSILLYQQCSEITAWQKPSYGTQEAFFTKCTSPENSPSTVKSSYEMVINSSAINPLIIEKCTTTQQGYFETGPKEKTTCATYQDYQQCSNKGLL